MEYIKEITLLVSGLGIGACNGCCFFKEDTGECLDVSSDRVCWDENGTNYIFKEQNESTSKDL